ncbi:MAG: PKD domain-containing protein [Candidatus Phosphoribacter sp.]
MVVPAQQVRAASEVHLVAAGDFGARAATDTVLTRIADLNPDAALALGDLAYRDAVPETAWCAYVKARVGEGFPFQLISGNHESLDVHDGDINNFSACLPNQIPGVVGTYGREYYMDLPQGTPLVRVINISPALTFEDGIWSYAAGDPHYTWLSAAIDGGRAKGAKWIVVTAHVPCLSVGTYTCPAMRDVYNLLLAKRVDLVLHGHEHAYMRTHQLRNGVAGCPTLGVGAFVAACVADSDSAFAQGQGTVFATVGTGGTPLRDINAADSEAPYFAAFSGLNANPAHGLIDIHATDARLSAQFVTTSGGPMQDAFVIDVGQNPPNNPPVALMTSSVQDLTVTVNGSGSSDADGTITGYLWAFGDGASATGVSPPPHTYAAAGTYPVTLTVTDDDGATASTTTSVTVTAAQPALAQDAFARVVSGGWGQAPVGGLWTSTSATSLSVAAGRGLASHAAGRGVKAYLRSVSSAATDLTVTLSPDKVPGGSGLYVSVLGRSIVGAGDYTAKVRLQSNGTATITPTRLSATGVETTFGATIQVPNLTVAPGTQIRIRVQVYGSSPTTVRAKAWNASQAEPSTWLVTATDATAGLQGAGSVGLSTYYSSGATNSPLVLAVDDLIAITATG